MIWIDAENWCALYPLEDFEELQRVRTLEREERKQQRLLEQQLRKEEEEKEKEEREKALSEYQKLQNKNLKKKNKKSVSIQGIDYPSDEEEDDEEEGEGDEIAAKKKQDYSFLDDIEAENTHKGEFNLKLIKQQSKRQMAATISKYYDSDSLSEFDSDGEEAELQNRSDDYYDYLERKEQSRIHPKSQASTSKGGSIERLLDSFESHNSGGKGLHPNQGSELIEEGDEEDAASSPLVQHWNMINHLPEAAVTYFQFTIGKLNLSFVSQFFN